MSWQQSIADIGFKAMNKSHQAILRLSGGRVLHSAFGMPVVELHTIGRTTGQNRVTLLAAPIHDENRVVLVASKGGDDRDPEWYRNLMVNPDADVIINGKSRKVRAHTASVDEKAELWPQIVSAYKGYGGYQDRTERTIPVVICEARPD